MWCVSSIRFAEKKKSVWKWFETLKYREFDSKKYIFQVFRPKTAWIKAYDGLKFAPTIAAIDVSHLAKLSLAHVEAGARF